MKLVLMGTPEFVVPIFDELANAHEIIAVFTRAPKPTGRKMILTKTPVHIWAENRGFDVYTSIKDFDKLRIKHSEFSIIVIAYGVILKDNVLNAAPCVNVHPSILPLYRGPSPITAAIINGDAESGVCIMRMVAEVDAGDVYLCEKFPIGENEVAADVEARVSEIAPRLLLEYLAAPEKYPGEPQDNSKATFTKKITNADTIIDWTKSPRDIHNQIRAIGGRTKINDIDCKILKTHIENDKLVIDIIQPAGKKAMSWKEFKNGLKDKEIKLG